MARTHFHSLDALRFFSFFLVFIHHLPISDSSFLSYFAKSGATGVSFFFVLSGFLITYILIYEKSKFEKISLKKFFTRRILKIWPLFYAILLFAFLTPYILRLLNLSSSDEGYEPNWLVSIFFLENYKMMYTGSFPNTSPLSVMWSLCVEEHFYIIWCLILYFIPIKRIPILIAISIIVANIFRSVYHYLDIETLDVFSNIDYFAYGAIPAYIFMRKKELLEKVSAISLNFKYATMALAVIFAFLLPNLEYSLNFLITPLLYGLLFSSTIFFTTTKTNYIYINDNNLISKLGIYTYGLYLYHGIFINLMIKLLKNTNPEIKLLLISVSSLLITIIVSILSYNLFEKKFLDLKKYFN